jgi:hypothetical protein
MSQLDTVLDTILHMQYLADPKCVEMDFAEWKHRQRPVPTNPQTHKDIGGEL